MMFEWPFYTRLNNDDTEILRGLHKPRPKEFIKKVDCRDSMKGIICGVCIFLIAVVDICLFFGFNYHAQTKVRNLNCTLEILHMIFLIIFITFHDCNLTYEKWLILGWSRNDFYGLQHSCKCKWNRSLYIWNDHNSKSSQNGKWSYHNKFWNYIAIALLYIIILSIFSFILFIFDRRKMNKKMSFYTT